MKQWSGQEQIVPEEEQVKTVKWYENPDGVTKACALVLLVAGLASLYLFCGDFWDKTFRLAVSGNVKALAEYLRSFGSYAVLVSFVIDVLINMGSVFPSVFVSTANGLIFGLPLGVTISWLAETVGVVFSFLLMRFFFRNTAERVIRKANKLQDIDRASEKNGIVWMTFARALPYVGGGHFLSGKTALAGQGKNVLKNGNLQRNNAYENRRLPREGQAPVCYSSSLDTKSGNKPRERFKMPWQWAMAMP